MKQFKKEKFERCDWCYRVFEVSKLRKVYVLFGMCIQHICHDCNNY